MSLQTHPGGKYDMSTAYEHPRKRAHAMCAFEAEETPYLVVA